MPGGRRRTDGGKESGEADMAEPERWGCEVAASEDGRGVLTLPAAAFPSKPADVSAARVEGGLLLSPPPGSGQAAIAAMDDGCAEFLLALPSFPIVLSAPDQPSPAVLQAFPAP